NAVRGRRMARSCATNGEAAYRRAFRADATALEQADQRAHALLERFDVLRFRSLRERGREQRGFAVGPGLAATTLEHGRVPVGAEEARHELADDGNGAARVENEFGQRRSLVDVAADRDAEQGGD